MSDKVRQHSTTTQGETNGSTQRTLSAKKATSTRSPVTDEAVSTSTQDSPARRSTTTVKPGGTTSTIQREDFAFQIQFIIPVRGGLGSGS
tara:strand:+ start:1346 stop:1615 length:270 start_codon:yes stop_codon:yes gene_type:complete